MEENKDSNIKSTIDAVTGLVKAVPVYNDAVQPAAQEIGKSLATVTKTINIALTPISALVWGYEKIQDYVLKRVSEKLKDRPEEKIVTPDPGVVGPSLEALRFSGGDINLRELYASLIATSMDSDKIKMAHPGFVEIIKNLSSEEALILKCIKINNNYPLIHAKLKLKDENGEHSLLRNVSMIGENSGIKNKDLLSNYIDNLCRLGLIEIPEGRHLVDSSLYKEVKQCENIMDLQKQIDEKNVEGNKYEIRFVERFMTLTDFGSQFCDACITELVIINFTTARCNPNLILL